MRGGGIGRIFWVGVLSMFAVSCLWLEEHQIVHEMRELLLDAAYQDLENFRHGFRLGYGPDGLRVFERVWKEAQIPLSR